MIGIEDAAEEASSDDPASRLGEVLKQFELANEEIDSEVARLHNKLAIATASLEHYLDDVEIVSSAGMCNSGMVEVTFPDGTALPEAIAAVNSIVQPDKTDPGPSDDGDGITIQLHWGEQYRNEVAEAQEVSRDGA